MVFALQQERSQLTSEKCVERNTTFEDIYGVNMTKTNCDATNVDKIFNKFQNCSLLPFYRWKNGMMIFNLVSFAYSYVCSFCSQNLT